MSGILLISTGGTIDKIYGTGKGVRDLHIGGPAMLKYLAGEERRFFGEVSWLKACAKDSLDMTSADRHTVAQMCAASLQSKIIITHGTDTMIKTAREIADVVLPGKTIVLTGASQPACMKDSDAEFNLGLALATCLTAQPGIYIAMNGVFPAHSCTKQTDGAFGWLAEHVA